LLWWRRYFRGLVINPRQSCLPEHQDQSLVIARQQFALCGHNATIRLDAAAGSCFGGGIQGYEPVPHYLAPRQFSFSAVGETRRSQRAVRMGGRPQPVVYRWAEALDDRLHAGNVDLKQKIGAIEQIKVHG
jgi:hypothetical protein